MNILFFFILFLTPNLNAADNKYHCECVISMPETADSCGMVSLKGTAVLADGTVIEAQDWYWFGGIKPNSNCFFLTEEAAKTSCAENIEYKRQQNICY